MPLSQEEAARYQTQSAMEHGTSEHNANANNLLQMVIEIPFPIQSPNPSALYGSSRARDSTSNGQEQRLLALRQQLDASTSGRSASIASESSTAAVGGVGETATDANWDAESARRPQNIRLSTIVQQCEASLVQTSWPLQNERCPMVIDRGLMGTSGGSGPLASHARSIAVNSETFLRLFGYSLERLAEVLDIDLRELRRREIARFDEILQVNLFNFRY